MNLIPDSRYAEFQFNPASLAAPRKPGISAYMRIKNEEQFVRLAIESHLPFYDEIIACYNDCTDNTEAILLDLQQQYPDKIRLFHYLPKVHMYGTTAHKNTPGNSVHSFANYSNYALSQCAYCVAAKLDADHLAIPKNLAPLIQTIRNDIAAGKQKFYYFSGVNLILKDGEILCGWYKEYPFSGNSDIFYHPVNEKLHFWQGHSVEKFNEPKKIENEYMGIMYFHLNFLKTLHLDQFKISDSGYHAMSLADFSTQSNINRMKSMLKLRDRLRYALYSPIFMRRLKYQLTRQHIRLRPMRLLRLQNDLRDIDFQRDVIDKLKGVV